MILTTFLLSQLAFCIEQKTLRLTKDDTNYELQEEWLELKLANVITITKTKFSRLHGSSNGGAVYIDRTYAIFDDCLFDSCYSKNGGALYILYSTQVPYACTFTNCQFNNNTATRNGGAININYNAIEKYVIIDGCTFTENSANNGGAIYAIARDHFIIKSSTFTNNSAKKAASLNCRIGPQNGGDQDDSLVITDTVFSFTPSENFSNVYINNIGINDNKTAPASVFIGGCTFSAEGSHDVQFLHLEIDDSKNDFSAVNFYKCNCFRQGSNTVKIPSDHQVNNCNFECSDIDSCTPGTQPSNPVPQPPNPELPQQPTQEPTKEPTKEPTPVVPDEPENTNNRIPNNNTLVVIDVQNTKFSSLVDDEPGKIGGGAICVDSNRINITVTGCTFEQCKASNGGAIHVLFAKINESLIGNVVKSTFMNCEATNKGGAVDVNINQQRRFSFTFNQCTFTSNKAKIGGAICATARDMLTLLNCKFEDNEATTSGSSLYLELGWNAKNDADNTFVIEGNTFTFTPTEENKVNVHIQTKSGDYKNARLRIGGNTFSATQTIEGYMNLEIIENSPYQSVVFTGCNCVQQGVETTSFPTAAYPITNFNFNCNPKDECNPGEPIPAPPEDNTPDDEGYIQHKRIDDEGKNIDLSNYKFSELGSNDVDGGAILNYGKGKRVNISLNNCKFTSCRAANGGAIRILFASVDSLLVCSIRNSIFEKCEAKTNGGAIYIESTVPRTYKLDVSSCTFTSNKAGKNGGAAYIMACDNFTMNNCVFNNNEAERDGSSVWCRVGSAQTNISDNTATFNDNTFIFAPKTESVNVYIDCANVNTTASNNKYSINAVLNLGQCRFSASNTEITEFKHLEIVSNGDGFQRINFPDCVCIAQGSSTVSLPQTVSDSTFTYDCQAFSSCKADAEGYNYHGRIEDEERTGPIELENFKFKSLINDAFGGAITIDKQKASITISKCKFDSCSGQMGGAIYILYSGSTANYTCTVMNTIFSNNEAQSNGGAFYCEITQTDRHAVTLSYCTFKSNNAGKFGGAVYAMARDRFTLENCIFEDNVASQNIGSSLWLRIGWNDKYNANKGIVRNNTLSFTPQSKKDVNVHIETYPLLEGTSPNANLDFGLNTFVTGETSLEGYLQFEIVETVSPFESINFIGCNCVQDDEETVFLPYPYVTSSFNFNCKNSASCATPLPSPVPTPDKEGYTPSQRIQISEGVTLRLAKTKFTSIESNYTGGAISLVKTSCSITDCKFTTCKSNCKSNGENNGGGAIYISYSTRPKNYVYKASIVSCVFTGCETTSQGGALNIKNVQTKLHLVDVEGCTFTNNKASNNGGAIYANIRDLLSIQHCTFNNNEALNGSSLWCQIGWNEGKDESNNLVLFNNKFTFSPAASNVFIQSNGLKKGILPNANVFIGLCSFEAQNMNGETQKHLVISEKGQFQSIVFSDCNCIQGGSNTVTITATNAPKQDNLKFDCANMDKCSTDSVQPPSTDECKSFSNHQEVFGKELSIEKTCFYNLKSSTREGGALRAVNCELELEDCRFINCTSEKEGGAVYIYYSIEHCELEIEDCLFENCQSNGQGGALYFANDYSSESKIKSCKFINNKAISHGGALFYSPTANSKLSKCLFVNNSCTADSSTHGSAVYAIIQNLHAKTAAGKLALTDDNDDDSVVIEGNRIRSEPVLNAQQMYVNVKKTGNVKIGDNSFSFNGANVTSASAKYVQVSADEGANVQVTGTICIDHDGSRPAVVSGIDSNIDYKCHKADAENDHEMYDKERDSGKKKSNTGLIIGLLFAGAAVIAIVVAVVIYFKRKNKNGQDSDFGNDILINFDNVSKFIN